MAGASLAWALAPQRRVLLLERESQPGYHSTGRSAATLHSSYGNATIRALTAASAPFYREPPRGLHRGAAVAGPLGVLMRRPRRPARACWKQEVERARALRTRRSSAGTPDALPGAGAVAAPRADRRRHATTPPCSTSTSAAILAGFLRGARARGAVLRTDAALVAARPAGGGWRLELRDGEVACDGPGRRRGRLGRHAWPGSPASRRSASCRSGARRSSSGRPPAVASPAGPWSTTSARNGTSSPTPAGCSARPPTRRPRAPCDAQPEELDVAICVERIEAAFDFPIRRIESRWAGLRCFARDKTPVAGFDPRAPGFFWLAGQGGYGIQTAPALAALAAALITRRDRRPRGWPAIDPAALAPARLLAAG